VKKEHPLRTCNVSNQNLFSNRNLKETIGLKRVKSTYIILEYSFKHKCEEV
jgi:hypothetical protein